MGELVTRDPSVPVPYFEVKSPPRGDDEGDHLACFCRPHISLCGCFNPSDVTIELVDTDDDEQLCDSCLSMWNQFGCGACGCRSEQMCARCRPRWEECQSGNGSAC